MFRTTPNGCTRRNMARFGRAGPPGQMNRGDPGALLRLSDAMKREIELEEIEKILFIFKQKERKS
jgi:hypothetical protein